MTDDGVETGAEARPVLCARCRRASRDQDDLTTWVALAGEQICPGCLTQSDRERLPMERDQ